jgi:hypothetical protein
VTTITARTIVRSESFKVSSDSAKRDATSNQRYLIGKLLKNEAIPMAQWEIGMESLDCDDLKFGEADKTIKMLALAIKVGSAIQTVKAERKVAAVKANMLSDSAIVAMLRKGEFGKVAQKRLAEIA